MAQDAIQKERDAFFAAVRKHDVLMGRGKRISEWFGNIAFRKLVNAHRNAYAEAHRSHKADIAVKVVKTIQDAGGRFLQENDEGAWEEITQARSIEKTCQALREKDKSGNPSSVGGSPSNSTSPPLERNRGTENGTTKSRLNSKGVKRPRVSPPLAAARQARKPRSARVTLQDYNEESDDDTETESDDDKSDDDSDGDDSSTVSETTVENVGSNRSGVGKPGEAGSDNGNNAKDNPSLESRSKYKKDETNFVSFRTMSFDDSLMMSKLAVFKSKFGHCAVPPGWPSNVKLADWSTVQRQLYREQKCRTLCDEERRRLTKLTEMGFPWDYQAWHWQTRHDELAKVLSTTRTAQEEGNEQEREEPKLRDEKATTSLEHALANHRPLVEWVEDQREQYREGYLEAHPDRVDKFRKLSIVL